MDVERSAFPHDRSTYTNPRRTSESDKWDLSHLFTNVDKWQEDVAWITRDVSANRRVAAASSANPPQSLAAALEFEKQLDLKIERVYHFASLQLAEDSANRGIPHAHGAAAESDDENRRSRSRSSRPRSRRSATSASREFLNDPALAEWTIALRKIRRHKPHILSEPEERLLALGSAALDGYDETFSQLTDVDMKFGTLVDDEGVERPLTQSSFSSFLVKRDHGLRKRAFHQFYARVRGSPVHPRVRARRIRSRPTSSAPARAIIRPPSKPRSSATTCRSPFTTA